MLSNTVTACLVGAAANNEAPCGVDSSERARQREIAAYLSAASFPPDLPSGPLPEPLLNGDPTLNALVQLGALRLGCDRAFLSFIDHQYQFVVAEITRSHSLTEKRCAPNEHIFLGVTKLDACWGVCPTTMKAFMDETGEWVRTGPNVIANRSRYIINDFTTEPGYTERPYVVDYPYFRSYLEVPVVSPLGYLLGSYCVVHNDLKALDDDATVEIMNEIAAAIMAHLELRRIQQSRNRSEQLIQGLSGFINYESPVPEPSRSADTPSSSLPLDPAISTPAVEAPVEPQSCVGKDGPNWDDTSPDTDLGGYPRPTMQYASSSPESSDAVLSPPGQASSGTPPTTPRDEPDDDPFARLATAGDNAGHANGAEDAPGSTSDTTELYGNGFISSANTKSTLYRAAAMIRRSMNMDGFMFLDAVPSSFADRSDQLAVDDQLDLAREEVVGPFCAAIVQSTAAQTGDRPSQSSQTRLPEAALQRFIRRFPHGHIFSADEFGPIDEIYAPGKPWPSGLGPDEDQILRSDVSTLFRVLPAAKYVVFRPLWHFHQECWYAVAVGWVTDHTRAIDASDVSLIAGFGNSVMAEVSRLEALATSRAKSDFVSSISHELRSPLHGIMAGSELLRDGVSHSPLLLSALDMLDSCGATLLDIFNNLLEHAIVTSSGGRYRATISNVRTADLGGLVEDVLDVVHTSHLSENAFQSWEHRKGSFAVEPSSAGTSEAHRPLLVALDIGQRPSWRLAVNTGAWKRIVMNIFGNALKYTKSGRIQVTLKEVQKTDNSGKPCNYISFSVQDTGDGMSSDYLKYKLFMPFSQENMHSPGMGLGLSIVQQLARGLGGTIDVRSSVGVGTLVEVLVPLTPDLEDTASMPTAVEHDRPSYDAQRRLLGGRTVCLVTADAYAATAADPGFQVTNSMRKRSSAVEQALKTSAGAALGMNVVLGTAECPHPPADVYVLDGDLLARAATDRASVMPTKYAEVGPFVLLCAGAGPLSCSKQVLERPTFHLHHPLGPRKLASVLSAAIEAGCQLAIHSRRAEPEVATPAEHAASIASFRTASIPALLKEDVPSTSAEAQDTVSPTAPSSLQETTAATANDAEDRSHHLLLVDDNPINVRLLATVMRRLKHTFSTACNGLEAVELYKESLKGQQQQPAFDIIFMDISMPVMDGFEATREIRQIESQAGVPRCKIVALTGLSSEESRNEAMAAGSDVFLTKPAKLDNVRRLINEQLSGSR